jgi:HK97 family phage major capsid protein
MPLDSITRLEAQATIPEDVANVIIQDLPRASVILGNPLVTRRVMSRKEHRMPILSTLPNAYWVDGDDGEIDQTTQTWTNKTIEAEKLGVIVAIPKDVLSDSDYDLWAEIAPRVTEAIGGAFDGAVLFGTNAPAAFPTDLVSSAVAANQDVEDGTGDDIAADINTAFGFVEEDGFPVNGIVSRQSLKARLRGLRTEDGALVFQPGGVGIQNASSDAPSVFGEPVIYSMNGAWDTSAALCVVGDWSQLYVGIRKDITAEVLTEATVGGVNLAETDQVGLKVTFRGGWQVANPPTRENTDDDTRFPFAVVTPAGS